MKLTLIFPPAFEPTQPYLSLPSLTAFLKNRKISVIQRDLNLEFYYYILNKEHLKICHWKNIKRFNYLNNKEHLEIEEQLEYKYLIKAITSFYCVNENINKAIEDIKDLKKFMDYNILKRNKDIIDNALNIVSCSFYPSKIEFQNCEIGKFPLNEKEIIKTLNNKKTNPFIDFYKNIIKKYDEIKSADIIGISIITKDQFISSLTLSKLLKHINPNIKIVMGGSFISRITDFIKKSPKLFEYFDFIIFNEGETSFYELIKALNKKKDISDVSNLMYYQNRIKINNKRSKEDFSDLPTPDFKGFPLNKYLSPILVLPILASRGCYWGKCSFCVHKYPFKEFSPKKMENVFDDIKQLKKKYETPLFSFSDESFLPEHMVRLSKLLSKNKLNIKWFTFARFEKSLNQNTIKKSKIVVANY